MFSSSDGIPVDPEGHATSSRGRTAHGWLKAALLATGAGVGAMLPLTSPIDLSQSYSVETRLELLPAPAGLVEAGTKTGAGDLAEAVRRKFGDQSYLDAVARQMTLQATARGSAETPTVLGFLSDLITRSDVRFAALEATERDRLSHALTLVRVGTTERFALIARADAPGRAADTANVAADLLVAAMDGNVPDSAPVTAARQRVETLQAELEALSVPDAELLRLKDIERQTAAVDDELTTARSTLTETEERARNLAGLTVQTVLSNAVPEGLEQSGLEGVRRRFVDARLQVEQLSASLGPRHPRLMAAKSAEEEAKAAIGKALQTLTTAQQQQDSEIRGRIKELEARRSELAATVVPEDAKRKASLQVELEDAHRVYLDALRMADGADAPATSSLRRLDRAAEQAATVAGMPLWFYSLLGALAAMCLVGAVIPGRADAEEDDADAALREEPADLSFPLVSAPIADSALDAWRPAAEAVAVSALPTTLLAAEDEPLPVAGLPVMPQFEDYYQEARTGATSAALLAEQSDEADIDTRLGRRLSTRDPLVEALLGARQAMTDDKPLPQLLASILARRPTENLSPEPAAADEIRDIEDLRRSIDALRRKLDGDVAEAQPDASRRRAAGR